MIDASMISGRAGLRVVALSTLALVLLPQAAAYADTSASTANAAVVTVAGATVTSGQSVASNDGTKARDDQGGESAVSTLGSQTLVSAGVLTQHASAGKDGSSAACAGVVGGSGYVAIGSDGSCTTTAGASNGVVVALSSAVSIKADAIVGQCTATSDGTVTGSARLVNAAVYTTTGLTTTQAALPTNPSVGTVVTVPGVATLTLNGQNAPSGTGSIGDTALSVQLLGATASATLGRVTCGPNGMVVPTSAVPLKGLPLFGGILLLLGTAWWLRARRPMFSAHRETAT